jgi:hypothetical protein
MKLKLQERGQSLILIALAAIGLFGFAALAIDGSRVFSDRRHAQNAADAAALSAALAKIRNVSAQPYEQAAELRAADNGYVKDGPRTDVEVALCSVAVDPACQGIPALTSPHPTPIELDLSNPANYIQVKITSLLPATFARIVGRQEFKNIVTAIAYAGPVEPKPLADNYALAAMNFHDPDAIWTAANVSVDINNSGMFSNSDYTSSNCQHGSMRTGGNGTINVDTMISTVGDFCPGGNSSYDPNAVNDDASQIDLPEEVDIPDFSCSGSPAPSSYDGAPNFVLTIYPGNYNNLNLSNISGGNAVREVHFSPGTYCLSNGVSFNGPDIIANGVKFLVTGGEFKLNGSQFTCNDMQVHIDENGSGFSIGATSSIYCNNVTFFLSTGDVTWNGNADFRLFAPTGGDYEGLLFYMPPGNNSPIRINGNTTSQMTGTILAVSSEITIDGNMGATGLRSQIIGDTVNLLGNGTLVINYDPDDQYQPIDPSAIMLTK